MAQEIERKFLVIGTEWKKSAIGVFFSQGYLNTDPEKTVRVRLEGEKAFLTVKGKNRGLTRSEFQFPIDFDTAKEMLETLCKKTQLTKYRYKIQYCNHIFEIDEFLGDNAGLVIAEIELQSENEHFEKPEWLGIEVSGDSRYYNSNLVSHPYCAWSSK